MFIKCISAPTEDTNVQPTFAEKFKWYVENNYLTTEYRPARAEMIRSMYREGNGVTEIPVGRFLQSLKKVNFTDRKDPLYREVFQCYPESSEAKYRRAFEHWEKFSTIPGPSYQEWRAQGPYDNSMERLYDTFHTSEKAWQIVEGRMPEKEAEQYISKLLFEVLTWSKPLPMDLSPWMVRDERSGEKTFDIVACLEDTQEERDAQWIKRHVQESELMHIFSSEHAVRYFSLERFHEVLERIAADESPLDMVLSDVYERYFPLPGDMAIVVAEINDGAVWDRAGLPAEYRRVIRDFLQEQLTAIEHKLRMQARFICAGPRARSDEERRKVDRLFDAHLGRRVVFDCIDKYAGLTYSFMDAYLERLSSQYGTFDMSRLPRNTSMSDFYHGERVLPEQDLEAFIRYTVLFFGESRLMQLLNSAIEVVSNRRGLFINDIGTGTMRLVSVPGEQVYDLNVVWEKFDLHEFRKLSVTQAYAYICRTFSEQGVGVPPLKLNFAEIDIEV